jgi:predicted nucleic acid-binding protein
MHYFDTSFLVPLILPEPTSEKIQHFLGRKRTEDLAISHWTCSEFASVLALKVRMGKLNRRAALDADAQFHAIVAESFIMLLPTAEDFDLCRRYLLGFKTGLRAGDALHLAIAHNHRASTIYTLDKTLLKAGKRLGLPVKAGIQGV